jgi:hypothetical protein
MRDYDLSKASMYHFPDPVRELAHNSRPGWLVRPSLLETCTPSQRAGLSSHTPTSRCQPPQVGVGPHRRSQKWGYALPEPRPAVLPSNPRAPALIHKPYTINHITNATEGSWWRAALWHGSCPMSGAQAGGSGRTGTRRQPADAAHHHRGLQRSLLLPPAHDTGRLKITEEKPDGQCLMGSGV